MKQNVPPAVVGVVVGIVAIAILAVAWRALAPAPPAAKTVKPAQVGTRGQPPVTRLPDGSLQFSPEAQAHRGPNVQQPGDRGGGASLR